MTQTTSLEVIFSTDAYIKFNVVPHNRKRSGYGNVSFLGFSDAEESLEGGGVEEWEDEG